MRFITPGRYAPAALAGLLLTVCALNATAKPVSAPKLKSSSVLIFDPSDSSVLYSRNPDVAAPIASITKLMTALVVLDAKQPLDEPLEITQAEQDLPKGGYFPPGCGHGSDARRFDAPGTDVLGKSRRPRARRQLSGWHVGHGECHEREGRRARDDDRALRRSDRVVQRERREPRGPVQAGHRRIAESDHPGVLHRQALHGARPQASGGVSQYRQSGGQSRLGTSLSRRPAISPKPAGAW